MRTSVAKPPAWLTYKAGILETVPKPWTPVRAQNDTLSCWGRTHGFAGRLLPSRIASNGKELLARPMGLDIVCAGKPLRWTSCRVSPPERQAKGRFIKRTAVCQAGDLLLSSETTLNYDGTMKVDLRLAPLRPVTLDSLTLTLPVRLDQAEWALGMLGPGTLNQPIFEVKSIPESGCSGSFHPFPYLWLGNAERGLAWFCESDQDWDPGADALRLERQTEAVVFAARIIRAPRQIVAPLEFSFGLLANPWRPPEKGCRHFNNYHSNWLYDRTDADLRKLVEQGVRTLIFHSLWSDLHAYPGTAYGQQLKRLVRRCHRHGLKLLVYLENQMSCGAPEWSEWGKERWRIIPKQVRGYMPNRGPQYEAFRMCFQSEWVDFTMYKVERLLREYDLDGVYLDGWPGWSNCENALHGCGYTRADGTRQPTYNIWKCREALERMYNVVKSFKKDGRISLHANPGGGTASHFGTDCFGGEQYGGDFSRCGLFPIRAIHLGEKSWGVFSELITYVNHDYGLAAGLLHNVLPRPWEGNHVPSFSVWKARDVFGVGQAEWQPYWKNAAAVKGQTDKIKVSFWRRRGQGLLLVAANLGKEQATAELTFGGKLGWRGAWNTLDLLPGTDWSDGLVKLPAEPPARADGGRITLKLPAGKARMIFAASPDATLWPKMRAVRQWIADQAEAFNRESGKNEPDDEWVAAGPFGDSDESACRVEVTPDFRGLETVYAPEAGPFDPGAEFEIAGGRKQGWLKITARKGEVILRPEVGRMRWDIIYLYTRVNFPLLVPSSEDNPVDLHFRSCNAFKVWVNGQVVFTHGGAGTPRYGQRPHLTGAEDVAPAVLHPGWNTVLVKLVGKAQAPFIIRITGRGDETIPPLAIRALDE